MLQPVVSSSATAKKVLFLAVLAGVVVFLTLRSCARREKPEPAAPPSAMPKSQPPEKPVPLKPVETAPKASSAEAPPVPKAVGETGAMLSLTVKFQNGRLVEVGRETVPSTAIKVSRRIDGQPGLYLRIMNPDGAVVFENMVADPRMVPWDTTDDGKTLRGGVIRQDDLPLHLRLPAGIKGQLEVFELKTPNWTRSMLDKQAVSVGNFAL